MRFKYLIFIFSGFIVLAAFPWGMEYLISRPYEERIVNLESYLKPLESFTFDSVGKHDLAIAELKLSVQALKQEVSQRDYAIRSTYYPLLTWGLPLTLLGLFAFGYSIYGYAIEEAKKRAAEEIDRRYVDPEKLLLNKQKVTVLAYGGKGLNEVGNLLQRLEIPVYELKAGITSDDEFDKLTFADEARENIYLLYNESKDNSFSTSVIDTLLKKTDNKAMVFWYGSGSNLTPEQTANPRVSSARFASQVYANLLNLLQVQRRLNR